MAAAAVEPGTSAGSRAAALAVDAEVVIAAAPPVVGVSNSVVPPGKGIVEAGGDLPLSAVAPEGAEGGGLGGAPLVGTPPAAPTPLLAIGCTTAYLLWAHEPIAATAG